MEIRYNRIEHYDQEGHLLTVEEIPYEVYDAELLLEQIGNEVNEANDQALIAYQNFDNLTAAQRNKILKALLGDYIKRHPEKYGG